MKTDLVDMGIWVASSSEKFYVQINDHGMVHTLKSFREATKNNITLIGPFFLNF